MRNSGQSTSAMIHNAANLYPIFRAKRTLSKIQDEYLLKVCMESMILVGIPKRQVKLFHTSDSGSKLGFVQ